jgi:pimeloyl-ACP methyl ester carboxylesterase
MKLDGIFGAVVFAVGTIWGARAASGVAGDSPGPVRAGRTPDAAIVRWTTMTLDGVPGSVARAECDVPEHPGRPRGRSITLTALVLRADSSTRHPDPIVVFQGGPGQSATELAAFYAEFFARERRSRDIVLLDQRGTGKSGALLATVPPEHLLDELGAIVPGSWIAPTLASVRAFADPAEYTTSRIVDDAHRVLLALGYPRANLYGTSYGTRCALAFMRRYPRQVRTSVLKNVLPMSAIIPLSYAANAQRALGLLLAEVDADSAARASYPRLGVRLDSLLLRLAAMPGRATITHPLTRAPVEVELTRRGVAMTLRMMLMTPQGRSAIPYAIDRAASGSLAELAAQMVQMRVAYTRTLALGMAMSVIAAEDWPRVTSAGIVRDTSGSFLGDAALASFKPVGEAWPHAEVDRGFFDPVRSGIPTLLVSGRLDPATPPEWGAEAARTLPNSAHVVFRYAAHPNAGFGGLDTLTAAFIERGSVKGLDLSCADRGETPPFRLPSR